MIVVANLCLNLGYCESVHFSDNRKILEFETWIFIVQYYLRKTAALKISRKTKNKNKLNVILRVFIVYFPFGSVVSYK